MSTYRCCSGSSWRSETVRHAAAGAALAALLVAGGCGLIPEEWLAEDALFIEAVPDRDRTRIHTPVQARDAGDPAISVEVMEQVSGTLNGLTYEALGILDLVLTQGPTTYEQDRRVWGPDHTELWGLTYALTVEREAAARFAYQFHASPGDVDEPELRTMWGHYRREGDGVGTGSFVLDLDVVAELTEDPGFGGRVGVVHDLGADGSVHVGMDLTEAELPVTDSVVVDGLYAFRSDAAGGEFCYDARYPLLDTDSWEQIHAYARWDGSRAGRADAVITGGELGTDTLQVVECWDAAGDTTYYWDETGFEDGDPASCVVPAPASLPECNERYPDGP